MQNRLSPTMEGRVMLAWKRWQGVWEDLTSRMFVEPTAANAGSQPHRMVVLLIGRDYSLRESLGMVGILNRWDVCWARSCGEAIDILGLRSIPLVICDEEAPEGWRNIVERIVDLPLSTCVILASRFRDESLKLEARRCHVYDVIAKPLDWEEVRDCGLFAWAWYTSGCASWWSPNADDRVLRQH